MSHTIRKINIGNSALVESTIVDYVQGGENYTLAELGITGPIALAIFLSQASFVGDRASTIKPRLLGGNIILDVSPAIELPSTVGLNYTLVAIVHGT